MHGITENMVRNLVCEKLCNFISQLGPTVEQTFLDVLFLLKVIIIHKNGPCECYIIVICYIVGSVLHKHLCVSDILLLQVVRVNYFIYC